MTESASAAGADGRSALKPWQFYLTASFLAAAAAVWLSPPASPIALLLVSLAIGAAGASAAALHAVLRALAGRTAPEDQVSESLREALEREKLLTLRAIKDLQFDTAMGKVSAADAAPMEARLRERAAAIMAQLDGREAVRARVEKELAQRLAPGSRLPAHDRIT
ncbi:MAG TPA: hypothetical protein VFZ36_01310, partial [Vicinamibacterales bacterium]